jgi:hypothetical protein
MPLNGSSAKAKDPSHPVDGWPAPAAGVCVVKKAEIRRKDVQAYACFSELWNKVLCLWNSVEFLAFAHHAPLSGLRRFTLWGDRMPQSGGPRPNEKLRRFFLFGVD